MRQLSIVVALIATGCASTKLVGRVSEAPGSAFLIQNVNVFDGERAAGVKDVRIFDGKIDTVAEAGSLQPSDGEEVIDGKGRTLLPGFIDMHAHLESHGEPIWAVGLPKPDDIANAYLWAGVTRALVMQGSPQNAKLVQRVRAGEVMGPAFHLTGPRLTGPESFPINVYEALLPWPFSSFVTKEIRTASNAAEARAAVDDAKADFAPEFFKITCDSFPPGAPKLSPEAMTAAIHRAKEVGIRPVAHIGAPEDVMIAAEAGLALFAHPPTSAVFTDEQVARLAELKIPFLTTQRFLTAPGDFAVDHGSALDRELVTPKMLEALANRPKDFEYPAVPKDLDAEAVLAKYKANLAANIKKLFDAGVPVFIGTDAGSPGVIPGASLHRELRALAATGVSNEEVLRAATSAPADFLDATRSFGRVAAGQRADLVLVSGDPLQDLAATEQVADVFFGGKRLIRTKAQ